MKFGIDCASPATNTAGLKQNHVEFVCRYLSPPGNSKNITKNEAAAIVKAGLELVVVWELNGDEALQGKNRGIQDARLAVAEATAAGMPKGSPIYFAFDRDPTILTSAELGAIRDYFRGAASVLGQPATGVYGGYDLVKALFDSKVVAYGWQTYAWSGGKWDLRAQLRQYLNAQTVAGIGVDFDHATHTDFGQWRTRPTRKIGHWTIQYRDRYGRIQHRATKHPRRWAFRHRRPFLHGAVTFHRVFDK